MNKTESVAGKATRRMQLKNMPLDRFEDGVGFIHATGCDCFVDGEWVTEYEDGIYEDAPGCVYEDEEDDEPEWTEEETKLSTQRRSNRIRALKILNWEENR